MSRKMTTKLCFLINRMIMGGIEQTLIRLLEGLLHLNKYEIYVVIDDYRIHPQFRSFFNNNGIKFSLLKRKKEAGFLNLLDRKFIHLINKIKLKKDLKQYDLIIDYNGCYFLKFLSSIEKPKFAWFHSGMESYLSRLIKDEDKIFNTYSKFIVLTDDLKNQLSKRVLSSYQARIARIYNPIPIKKIKYLAEVATHPRNTERYFCLIARMDSSQKDHLTAIYAFVEFLSTHPAAKFYLIGDRPQKQDLIEIVQKYGAQNNIIFTGEMNNPYGYLKYACANILSSKFEGLPSVLIEAQVLSVLNISSDCSCGPSEILLNGSAGILFPIGDVEQLRLALCSVWDNKQNFEHHIKTATNHIDRFSTETVIPQVDSLIQQTLDPESFTKT